MEYLSNFIPVALFHLTLQPPPFHKTLASVKKRQACSRGKEEDQQPNQLLIIVCWGEREQDVDLKVKSHDPWEAKTPGKEEMRIRSDQISGMRCVLPSSCSTRSCPYSRRFPTNPSLKAEHAPGTQVHA